MAKAYVRKRGNRWQVTWRANGKQPGRTFGTMKEADNFAAIINAELVKGTYFDPNAGRIRYGEFFAEWLPTRTKLQKKTVKQYQYLYDKELAEFFGYLSVNKISKAVIMRWMSEREAAGVSAHTIKAAYHVLQSSLNHAVLKELRETNPCTRELTQELPQRGPSRKHITLTPEEVRAVSRAVPDFLSALVYVQTILGLRPSEAIALRIGDINFLDPSITIRQVAVNNHGHMEVRRGTKNTNKTGKWEETVPMPAGLADILAKHISNFCTNATDDDELVFKGKKGGILHGASWNDVYLKKAGASIGYPKLTEYDLRASGGTIALGVGPLFAKDLLRHSKLSMTFNHYLTSNSNMDDAAKRVWETIWFESSDS